MMNKLGELPETAPVMVLSGCNLFPQCLLPLYIFERHFREMLEYALDSDRMICIGTRKEDSVYGLDEEIHQFSTIGIIRACVEQEDGTSNLVLQGVKRVRFVSWGQVDPFRIAQIEPLDTLAGSGDLESDALLLRIRELARDLIGVQGGSRVCDFLDSTDDPEVVADVISFHCISDPYQRQHLLGISDLEERLREVIGHLEAVGGSQHDPLFE